VQFSNFEGFRNATARKEIKIEDNIVTIKKKRIEKGERKERGERGEKEMGNEVQNDQNQQSILMDGI